MEIYGNPWKSMGKLWKPMVERRWKLMVFQKNMIYMSRFSKTKRLLKSNCKILMILQVNNFVNGIHLQSTFTKRTSSSKLDATVEPRGPPRRLRQLFHHLSGREIVCDPWKFERPWQMMTGPGAFFKKTSPWKYTSLC